MSMGRLLDDRRFRLWIHSSRGSIERTLDWDELHEPQNVHRWRCLDGNQPGSLAHSRKTSVGPDYNRRVDIVQPIGTHFRKQRAVERGHVAARGIAHYQQIAEETEIELIEREVLN